MRSWRWCQRNPSVALLACALVLAVILGFAGIVHEAESRRRQQYFSDIVAAQDALHDNDIARAQKLLSTHQALGWFQADLRRFEWYYLWNQCRQSTASTRMLEVDKMATSIAFKPDGTMAVGGLRSLQIRQPPEWEAATFIKDAHLFPPTALAFRPPHYDLLASCGLDETLKLWNLKQSEVPTVLHDLGLNDTKRDHFSNVSFSYDGRWLATNDPNGAGFLLWDVNQGTFQNHQVCDRDGRPVGLNGVVFSPITHELALACRDGWVRRWRMDSETIDDLWHHEMVARAIAWSPDGTLLASTGDDSSVLVGDTQTGMIRRRFLGHGSRVFAVAFAPNGETWQLDRMTLPSGYGISTIHNQSVFSVAIQARSREWPSHRTVPGWPRPAGMGPFECGISPPNGCRTMSAGTTQRCAMRLWLPGRTAHVMRYRSGTLRQHSQWQM